MPTVDRPAVFRAWLSARWTASRLRSVADVEARQNRLWRAMAPVVAQTPAVAHLAGRPLADFPIVSPQEVREHFEQWNTLGMTRSAAEAGARDAETGGPGKVAHGVAAGFSSGSSGPPGIFLNNRAERAAYLGHLIARLLPKSAMVRRKRIALCLRARASLYSDVTGAGRFRFLFIDLAMPPEEKLARLEAFNPHVFIAPAHVLAELTRLVESGSGWHSARLFWGAEPMGELERDWIDAILESRPSPIYQATEGFIGAPCRDGTLHLNEDVLIVEREPVDGTNRFVPIITDLRRTSQPMIRMRLPDLLEALPLPCSCGSPLAAIRPVEGRLEDMWRWGEVAIPPRSVDEAVSAAIGPEEVWRAVAGPAGVVVEAAPEMMDEAVLAVKDLLRARGVTAPVTAGDRPAPIVVKRRRVRWIDG